VLLGQDPEVAKCARDFYVYQLPGFYCLYAADFLRTYMNSQNIYKPLTYITLTTSILHVIFSTFISSRYGMTGIIISTNLTMFCEFGITFYMERKYSVWKLDLD
jgi:Na+-driven multidrug efflux pump